MLIDISRRRALSLFSVVAVAANAEIMFPAYGSRKETSPKDGHDGQFEWLQNESYTRKAAETLVSIEQELLSAELLEKDVQKEEEEEEEAKPAVEQTTKFKRKNKKSRHESKLRSAGSPSLEAAAVPDVRAASGKIFLEDVGGGLCAERAFHVDQRPDRTNLAFTTLPHLQIAKYERKWSCLGLQSKQQAELYWLKNSSNFKGKKTKKQPKRDRRYYTRLKDLYDEENILDFSPASFKRKKIAEREGSTGQSSRNDASVGDGAKAEYKESASEYSKRLTIEFNEHLRKFPHDVNKWIEFVEFQDDVQLDLWSARAAAHKFVLEKKVAILDKATECNPSSLDLLLIKFELCQDVWDTNRLTDEWKKLLFLHPNETRLWSKYLLFFHTQFSTFTVSRFGRIFSKCFSVLKRIHDGTFLSHQPLPDIEAHMIEIFGHYCHILCQSGYREKAIACFQALIEFNFFRPLHLSEGSTQRDYWLAFFEPFWDSGVPRFGEDGALGWRLAMEQKELLSSCKLAASANEDGVLKPSSSKSKNWLRLERFRNEQHWLPWRQNGVENECDDPDRSILFDDVSACLFYLKQDDSRFLLVLRFLEFLGVCVEPHLQFTCDLLGCHHPTFVEQESQVLQHCRHFRWSFYSTSSARMESSLNICKAFVHPSSDECRAFVERVIDQSMKLFSGKGRAYEMTFVAMRVAHCESESSHLTAVRRFKDSKMFVKKMLKADGKRNDLRLWCAYATLEWQSGNQSEARKIFDIALTMKFSNDERSGAAQNVDEDEESVLDLCHAHRVAAELEMSSEGCHLQTMIQRVTQILVHFGTEGSASLSTSSNTLLSSSLLRARSYYRIGLEKLLEDGQNSTGCVDLDRIGVLWNCGYLLAEWTICYALFEYVTEGLTAANKVYDRVLLHLEEGLHLAASTSKNRFNCEFLYMSYVKLHVMHSNYNIVSLRVLRGVLSRAIHLFPENRHLNSLFLDIEAKSHIAGRVRHHYNLRFQGNRAKACSAVSVVHSIEAELERQKNLLESQASTNELGQPLHIDTGIIHRLRALFQKTVNLPQLRSCVLLWRLYLKFEVMQGNNVEGKEIFYQALQQCPWAKVLYFDAIQYFPNDLQEISDILTEKEIRVRAPLEEVLILLGSDMCELQIEEQERNGRGGGGKAQDLSGLDVVESDDIHDL